MPVNHVVLASGAVVAVSVAVAAALAMYENPELRRYADDIRRRIAVALHSLGDGINPAERAPRFNRPEDAEGFLQSSRGAGAEPGVDADEATRRRQREELLYWNSVLLKKKEEESAAQPPPAALPLAESSRPRTGTRGSSFDDFLRQDENAEQGTYVFNTGADIRDANSGLHHRVQVAAPVAAPVAAASLYANPFADEHCIANDEVEDVSATYTLPQSQEHMSDIYSATTRENDDTQSRTLDGSPALIELPSPNFGAPSPPPATLERQLAENEYMSAGQDDREDAYASIQAWAHDSGRNFYSPLPVTPVAPVSEPEVISDGQLTPTDSVSIIGSGECVGNDNDTRSGRPFDVMSESEGMLTPASWSEVGSVVSETEGHGHLDVSTPLHG